MFELMTLAFQTDSTRIATFIVAHDGSNRPYPTIGIRDGHHDLSHHRNDEEKKKLLARINRIYGVAARAEPVGAYPANFGFIID